MKKFNMFALIALSLAVSGNVGATFPTSGGGAGAGFLETLPTAINNQKGQLAALKMLTTPTSNNLMSHALKAGTPTSALAVSAMGALTANTKAGTKAKFDSMAFQAGAQVMNEQTSAVAGGSNQMGQNIGASGSVQSNLLTGANLRGALTSLTPIAATSAMSTLTSNTKNSGNVSFVNSSQPKWGNPGQVQSDGTAGTAGGAPASTPTATGGMLGNVTTKIGLTTQGSNNAMGGSIGSSNRLDLTGNYGSNS